MSERDAFGREKGEDSLANMGWNSSVQAAAGDTGGDPDSDADRRRRSRRSPPATSRRTAPAPAWTPGPRQSYARRRRRSAFGIIVPLFIIGIFAVGIGGAVTAFNAGSDALDGITSSIETATNGTHHHDHVADAVGRHDADERQGAHGRARQAPGGRDPAAAARARAPERERRPSTASCTSSR